MEKGCWSGHTAIICPEYVNFFIVYIKYCILKSRDVFLKLYAFLIRKGFHIMFCKKSDFTSVLRGVCTAGVKFCANSIKLALSGKAVGDGCESVSFGQRNMAVRNRGAAGSILIEAIVLIALIVLLAPVIYANVSQRRDEIANMNKANSMLALQKEVTEFLKSEDNRRSVTTPETVVEDGEEKTYNRSRKVFEPSCPWDETNKVCIRTGSCISCHANADWNDLYVVGMKRNSDNGDEVSALIVEKHGEEKPNDARASWVSHLMGVKAGVKTALSNNVYGMNGTWHADPASYGIEHVPNGTSVLLVEHKEYSNVPRTSDMRADGDVDLGDHSLTAEKIESKKTETDRLCVGGDDDKHCCPYLFTHTCTVGSNPDDCACLGDDFICVNGKCTGPCDENADCASVGACCDMSGTPPHYCSNSASLKCTSGESKCTPEGSKYYQRCTNGCWEDESCGATEGNCKQNGATATCCECSGSEFKVENNKLYKCNGCMYDSVCDGKTGSDAWFDKTGSGRCCECKGNGKTCDGTNSVSCDGCSKTVTDCSGFACGCVDGECKGPIYSASQTCATDPSTGKKSQVTTTECAQSYVACEDITGYDECVGNECENICNTTKPVLNSQWAGMAVYCDDACYDEKTGKEINGIDSRIGTPYYPSNRNRNLETVCNLLPEENECETWTYIHSSSTSQEKICHSPKIIIEVEDGKCEEYHVFYGSMNYWQAQEVCERLGGTTRGNYTDKSFSEKYKIPETLDFLLAKQGGGKSRLELFDEEFLNIVNNTNYCNEHPDYSICEYNPKFSPGLLVMQTIGAYDPDNPYPGGASYGIGDDVSCPNDKCGDIECSENDCDAYNECVREYCGAYYDYVPEWNANVAHWPGESDHYSVMYRVSVGLGVNSGRNVVTTANRNDGAVSATCYREVPCE